MGLRPPRASDVWHCDAEGIYSDAVDPNLNTVGKKLLRGWQVTDSHLGAALH
jgi:protocatechuate 3,4-dioxygenase beta subunit